MRNPRVGPGRLVGMAGLTFANKHKIEKRTVRANGLLLKRSIYATISSCTSGGATVLNANIWFPAPENAPIVTRLLYGGIPMQKGFRNASSCVFPRWPQTPKRRANPVLWSLRLCFWSLGIIVSWCTYSPSRLQPWIQPCYPALHHSELAVLSVSVPSSTSLSPLSSSSLSLSGALSSSSPGISVHSR